MIDPVDITWDGVTVWVNGPEGAIGRFGRMGIDVHTADGAGCLDCTHEPTGHSEWLRFVAAMASHHHVTIPEEAMPVRFGE